MRWTGLVAYMGEMRNSYKICSENLNGRNQLGEM
jgi:hypothetical protein